uniref:homeobox protein unc-4 homolog n=1 Tax=Myodes glareolus TaxID=447135 RepID=UPI0020204E88|nr:homeobox protein unc-4 homolog [Myodes glareolus]
MDRRDTNYLLYEGLDKDEEKRNGGKAQIFFLTGEGRMEKDSGQGQAGAAAAEGEGAEEFSGEGPSVAGASGLMDNLKQEDQGTSRSDPEKEKQPKEPVRRDMEVTECVQPVSVLVRQRCFHYKFNQWQLQELERFFQQNHYISAELRKQLARWIGVSEARVQNWFKGRREQYKRDQKLKYAERHNRQQAASHFDAGIPDMERQNFDYQHFVGLDDDDDDDNWDEAEALRVLQAGEGRNEEASGWVQAGRGVAVIAAAAAAEGAGEGPSAAGAAGLVDDGNQEGAAGGHGQENEPQPQEPDRGAMGDNEAVAQLAPAPAPAPAPRPKHSRFARWQLSKLESVFQSTHYIKANAR